GAFADLQRWQATLEQDVKAIDVRLASKTASGGDDAALNEMRSAVQQIAKQLSAADPEGNAISADAQKATGGGSAPAGADAAQSFNQRKAELVAILDAIGARGDTKLAERAAGPG